MSKIKIDGEEWPLNIFTVTIVFLAASSLFSIVIGLLVIGGVFATLIYVVIAIGTIINDIGNLVIKLFKYIFKKKT